MKKIIFILFLLLCTSCSIHKKTQTSYERSEVYDHEKIESTDITTSAFDVKHIMDSLKLNITADITIYDTSQKPDENGKRPVLAEIKVKADATNVRSEVDSTQQMETIQKTIEENEHDVVNEEKETKKEYQQRDYTLFFVIIVIFIVVLVAIRLFLNKFFIF